MKQRPLHRILPFLVLLLLVQHSFCAKTKTEKIEDALKDIPSSYQQSLPKNSSRHKNKDYQKSGKKQRYKNQRKSDRDYTHKSNNAFGTAGGSIIKLILIIVGVFVLSLLVIYLFNGTSLNNGEAFDEKGNADSLNIPDKEEPTYDLSEADILALKGDLTEAIHSLYLEVINWLQKRGSIKIKKSLTNREILHASDLSIEKSRTLGQFIALVEELYFGDVPATNAEYEQSKGFAEAIMKRRNNG